MSNTRHKIVLVDDNIATLNQGKSLLQAFYKVYTVQSAATLFENLEYDIPDLILLDVEMPGMDGFETIKKLKSDIRYKHIPVIFLTSKSDEDSERKGFSLGAVDYITKPFSGPLLQKRISNQILYMRVQNAIKDYSTDLETMVEELAKANERTKILMEKTPLCARLWNSKYEMIDCNEAAVKLFGFKNKQEFLEKYKELYPERQPDGQLSVEKVKGYIKKAFDEGACEFEWMYKMLDGSAMPAVVILVRVELDDGYAVAAYIRDMREHYKMIESILEGEERVRLMLDAMPIACRLFGRDNKFIDCNREAMNFLGVKTKEEYIERYNEILPEFQPCGRRSDELKMEYMDKAFDKGYARFEWVYMKPGGGLLPCEITMVRVMYKGEYIIAGYARDLREQKAVIEEMRRAEIAEERNKAKSRFLATMSHEIRTPMNSIIGFADLALDMPDNSTAAECKIYLNRIKKSATWLLHIINDILDISKIESGKMELVYAPFDLNDVFLHCRSDIIPAANEKGLELTVFSEPLDGKNLIGDKTRLYQALMNLLSNAVKFTQTGEIKLSSFVKYSDDSKTTVYFEISDPGIGIAPEQISKIFDPFIQAESDTTRRFGGTGLGLSITKNIVELMGGTLAVESTPGAGTVFSFEITFESVITSGDSQDNKILSELEKPLFNSLALICEDNEMNQAVISEYLARVGIKSVIAENGRIGVEAVQERMQKGEKPFDIIFMDVYMPEMDGLEAATIINTFNTGTPIVAMTANIMAGDIENYRKKGLPDCLGKPFTSQELWRILLKYLTLAG